MHRLPGVPAARLGLLLAIVVAFLTTLTGVPLAHAAPEQTGSARRPG